MATGKVIRYDDDKGYGFIAPVNGGEDVFVHANEVADRGLRIRAGMQVEFSVLDTDRGYKAYDLRVIDEPSTAAAAATAPLAATASAPASDRTARAEPAHQGDEDDMLDVLSESEFGVQITELLLANGPGLTGTVILELRTALTQFARKNGWIE
jgi:CspA family cold shock protein